MTQPAITGDSLAKYLQEIGKYAVLNRDEEINLAKQIEEKGNKIIWAVFNHDPAFIAHYFVEQLPKKEKEKKEAIATFFTKGITEKISEEEFYARLESLRQIIPFVSTYKTVAETYLRKLSQEEENLRCGPISDDPLLDPMEELCIQKIGQKRQHLDELISAWEKPRDVLATHNLRFVIHVAKKYAGRSNLSILDCIQEGNQGLYRGVDGFDYRAGKKFSTYCSYWIRQSIQRSIGNTSRNIRIPIHIQAKMWAIWKAEKMLKNKLGRENVTDQEIAIELLRVAAEKKTKKKAKKSASAEIAAEAITVEETRLSYYETDAQTSLEDLNVDETDKITADPESKLYHAELSEIVGTVISSLSTMEQDIICRRFGIGYEREYTLHEISKSYHLSRERIRKLEVRALERLRKRPEIKKMRPDS